MLAFAPWLWWAIGTGLVVSYIFNLVHKAFGKKKKYEHSYFDAWSVLALYFSGSIFVIFFIFQLIAGSFAVRNFASQAPVEISSSELAALSDEQHTEIRGSFVLGTGSLYSINNRVFHLYARNERGAAEWRELPVEGTEVHDFYPADYVSRVVQIGVEYKCPPKLTGILGWFFVCVDVGRVDHVRWEFHVPRGTIVPNFVLDNQ